MKPMHSTIVRLSRCPCCQSQYSTNGMKKNNSGKSAARNKAKKEIKTILRCE